MKPFSRHLSTTIVVALAAILVSACGGEPDYPALLTTADSAYVAGDYHLGDSLLAAYKPDGNESKAVGMYRLLVETEQKYFHNNITDDDFSLCDSLCRYFKEYGTRDKYVKSLLFTAVSMSSYDYLQGAANALLEAENIAEENGLTALSCIISRELGDIYFNQRMLKECIPYYRRYYDMAKSHADTLRMAVAASRMGTVCTINNDIDSTIYYYKQSIELSSKIAADSLIGRYALCSLCDIYIQTEEYDSAAAIMPHDELNDQNWAYWHLGQNNVDSAIVHFNALLGKYSWHAETEYLRTLALIEERRGNLASALNYRKRLDDAEDSLKAASQTEQIRKVNAQYNNSVIIRERDEAVQKNSRMLQQLALTLVCLVASVAVSILLWRYMRERKERMEKQQRLLQAELDHQHRLSIQQQEENRYRIEQLSVQLQESVRQNNYQQSELISMEKALLELENKHIEGLRQKRDTQTKTFVESHLWHRLLTSGKEGNKRLTNEEWRQIANFMDETYDNITYRLHSLARLTEADMQMCYLVKLGVSPKDISNILSITKGAVTLARQRLYKKLTSQTGRAEDFDRFICNF